MLSLVVVLSVYYITSPEQKNSDLASVEEKAKNQKEQNKNKTKSEAKDGDSIVTTIAGDAQFEELRMKLEEARGIEREELTAIMANTNLPADQISQAKDEMQRLSDIAQKEDMLEVMIRSMGYEDALVRADGEQVKVTVKSKNKPSASEANKIILEVKKEIGNTNFVAVTFQTAK